jgi:hypothetical protein
VQLECAGECFDDLRAVRIRAAVDRLDDHAGRSLPLAIALNIVSSPRNLEVGPEAQDRNDVRR